LTTPKAAGTIVAGRSDGRARGGESVIPFDAPVGGGTFAGGESGWVEDWPEASVGAGGFSVLLELRSVVAVPAKALDAAVEAAE